MSHLDLWLQEELLRLGIPEHELDKLDFHAHQHGRVSAHQDFTVPLMDLEIPQLKALLEPLPKVVQGLLQVEFGSRYHHHLRSHLQICTSEDPLTVNELFCSQAVQILERVFGDLAEELAERHLEWDEIGSEWGAV